MVTEHFLSAMPSGVIEICREWFDEDCPVEHAIEVALLAEARRPYFCETVIGGALVWLKSRLMERGVLRALAREREAAWARTKTPAQIMAENSREIDARRVPYEPTPEQLQQMVWAMKWKSPSHLGYARSQISVGCRVDGPQMQRRPRVCHFEDHSHCPYCRASYRNGAALRLHVIDSHLSEYQE